MALVAVSRQERREGGRAIRRRTFEFIVSFCTSEARERERDVSLFLLCLSFMIFLPDRYVQTQR